MRTALRMTARQHLALMNHLYPGDGNEAVAVALCGRRRGDERHVLMVHQVYAVPHSECRLRNPIRVEWDTQMLIPIVAKAAEENLALVKFHSHPGGQLQFSEIDDISDRELMESVYGWMDSDDPHGSVVILPTGEMFGRTIGVSGSFVPIDKFAVIGDDILFYPVREETTPNSVGIRTEQTFGRRTTNLLKQLTIGVVGCSGTGSPVVEQLARLQVGKLMLVDPDIVEDKNLTRILNSFDEHAKTKAFKVDVLANAIHQMKLGTEVLPIPKNVIDADVVKLLAECDIIFGCMDGAEGRHYASLIAAFYLIPFFDLGVRLDADGEGGVTQVCGTVHYIQPGGSSLLTRGVYTEEELRSEGLQRTNPVLYAEQLKEKYIKGIREDRPAVISLNMLISSLAVNEMLARIHPFRNEDNSASAAIRVSLTDSFMMFEREGNPDMYLAKFVGRGDIVPLLNRAELSETHE